MSELPPEDTGYQTCRVCGVEKPLTSFHRHKGYENGRDSRCTTCSAHRKRSDRYGLEPREYLRMLFAQNSECAVCRTPHSDLEHGLVVDHDHVTGEVRLLLCQFCNTALGSFRDSPDLLRKAADYLELWQAVDTSERAMVVEEKTK